MVPVGSVDDGLLGELEGAFSRGTPLGVDLGGVLPLPRGEGPQVEAREILKGLFPSRSGVVLGVTEADLASPGRLYVFGQAALGHGVAVVSLFRLRHAHHGWSPGRVLLMERLYKVALHEVGHALGLSHCREACAMRVCTSVYQLDRVPGKFCPECRARLGWPP